MYIQIAVSNRHVHLSRKDIDELFGVGYQLTKMKDLKQPGQWAAVETVDLSYKGTIKKVRVLGPERPETQVELSMTDCRNLGVLAAIRMSGDLDNAASCYIDGPEGRVFAGHGVIVAKAHIHVPSYFHGVKDGEKVWVEAMDSIRPFMIEAVVRKSDNFVLEMHIDTDEANAMGFPQGGPGTVRMLS